MLVTSSVTLPNLAWIIVASLLEIFCMSFASIFLSLNTMTALFFTRTVCEYCSGAWYHTYFTSNIVRFLYTD